MPLQKLPPKGPLSVSAPLSQRPQIQNRRRTLQTISELSTNGGGLPDFVSSIGIESTRRLGLDTAPGVGRSTPTPVKRQSLPQHHSSLDVHTRQPANMMASAPCHEASNPRQTHGRRPLPVTIQQADGWNAKRERARMRHESEIVEARSRQSALCGGTSAAVSISANRSSADSRRSSIRHDFSPQTLLGKSDSCSCLNGQSERHAGVGATTNNTSQYDAPPATSERASTDSGSYQSRDSAINRSRSGSSNTSYTSQDAPPPLPHGTASNTRGYCAELISQNHNLVAFGESARSKNLNPQRSSRTMSLPKDGFKYASMPHRYVTTPDLRQLPMQQSRPISTQRARNQALAALTASNSHMQTIRYPQEVHKTPYQNRHASLSSHPPNAIGHRGSLRSNTSQHRPTLLVPAHLALPLPQSQRRHSGAPRRVSFEARTVPKRESLTQWKKEREEARVNFQTDHKARMQERVKRANEQELEREKELVLMGKRKKKRELGCFGKLLRALKGRLKSG